MDGPEEPKAAPWRQALAKLRAMPRSRAIAVGVLVACVLGGLVGFCSRPTLRQDRVSTPPADTQPKLPNYAPPDRQQIAAAYLEARQVLALEGVSGLARRSMACFRDLEATPTFAALDFCVALDAYGATAYRAAGGQPPPADSYFGQSDIRSQAIASRLIGQSGDPSSRVLDIRRLAAEIAQAQVQVQAQAQTEAQPQAGDPDGEAPSSPPNAPLPPLSQLPSTPPAAPRETVTTDGPPPPVAPTPPSARTKRSWSPSFDCGYARSDTERQICDTPALSRADRRLARVFERAMEQSPDPRSLRAEQDRWLQFRDRSGPDPEAILDTYERRIDELEDDLRDGRER